MNNHLLMAIVFIQAKFNILKKKKKKDENEGRKAVSSRLVNSPEKKLPEAANLATSAAEYLLLPSVMGDPFGPMVPAHPYIPASPPDINFGSFAGIDLVRYRLKTELPFSCSQKSISICP